ncbi:MAG TPA: hypothetical protein PKY59_13475 [Pyrinomonadaceae bacterium]|nr:hypothetical protein [Pyrinomonadaceae bacterium]
MAPTVGTGGSPGGPTGLFTVYDGQTLRKGEYTFSIAYSSFARDPGDVNIVEVPVSFQYGLTNNIELFFNTDAYRAIKVNSPRNLSSFYLPNSQLSINGALRSGPAIVLAPQGPGTSQFPNAAVFRPTGSQPFVQYPYVFGNAGTFGYQLPFTAGGVFGFPTAVATLGPGRNGGNGASNFPGIGSVYGSILPGVVLQTTTLLNQANQAAGEAPLVYALAPSYLNDAPFINRTYGESAFNTFTVGAKWRWTSVKNPIGVGIIPFYRWYADNADSLGGFNQLQRGASPGGNRGDIGAILFADARLRKWINISGNIGYIYNSDIKADMPGGTAELLDRGDEVLAGIGVDFPVNRYFQPILEFRSQQFVGGRTPNAFENNPLDGLAGVRIFPTRWFGMSFAYRYHANQQDRDSFDKDKTITASVLVPCRVGATNCTPTTITNTYQGIPPGFRASTDPHGFIVQTFIGRRDDRKGEVVNKPANVTAVTLSNNTISLGCPPGQVPAEGVKCDDSRSVSVSTTAVDPENDTLVYNYTVSGGKVNGSGANVSWDLTGVRPGTYTITAGVDDGCGVCGQTKTETVTVKDCPECKVVCECGTVSVNGPAGITQPGATMTFTAGIAGGTQESPTFNWTVTAGEIESGQGTSSITVRVPASGVTNITASVEVGGLCDRCPNTASETAGVAEKPVPEQVDEFGKTPDDDVKARIDNFYITLNNNPNAQGYIINYGTPAEIKKRRAQIMKAINFRKYDPTRVTMIDGGDQGTGVNTKFYVVPSGADLPTP